ncbi:hypothetical protein LZ31DRAFT_84701 [Colletotrichum somersetense]|nr:hypothetical protein LZ31DRAFT_84701 [Colletotrichum somersetense]
MNHQRLGMYQPRDREAAGVAGLTPTLCFGLLLKVFVVLRLDFVGWLCLFPSCFNKHSKDHTLEVRLYSDRTSGPSTCSGTYESAELLAIDFDD